MSKILNNNINEKIEIKNIYPLSPMQEGMLFHYLLDKNSKAYFEQQVLTIQGNLDIDIFEKSFNYIVERYDILRSIFEYERFKKPMQVVLKNRTVKVNYQDISSFKDKEKYVEDFVDKDLCNSFDLKKDVLIRIAIMKTDESLYKVIWSFHHILMDGWCNGIIAKDIFNVYHSLLNHQPINLSNTYSYMDYINWLKTQNTKEGIRYWETYLKDYANEISILGTKNEKVTETSSQSFQFKICENDTREINRIAYEMNSTVSTLLHAIWGILLQKYNNTNDVVFGTVVSGRNGKVEGIENMVGLFINTIPIRVKCDENTSFSELLINLQNELIESNKYDYMPLAEIQSLSELKQKLINNLVIFENYSRGTEMKNLSDPKKMGFVITDTEIHEQTSYNFNIMICPDDEIRIKISYNENMYDKDTVKRIQIQFENAIESIVKDKNILVRNIDILSKEEKDVLLYKFNDTYVDYPRDKTMHQLFEEQVKKTPDNIAVVFEDQKLTYKELNQRANRLARTLRVRGVKPDSIVGIMVGPSIEMIVGIMGVLKSGGAYLPIDPEYPADRILYTLEDSKTKILLTQENLIDKVGFHGEVLNLQDMSIYSENVSDLEHINTSKDLVYAIYTSGSTGNPKGVMIEHKAFNNFTVGVNSRIDLSMYKSILCLTTISFDIFALEALVPLLNGIKIVIADETEQVNSLKLNEIIIKNNIEVLQITPSRLQIFMSDESFKISIKSLKAVLVGGESFPKNLLKELNNYSNIKIYNMYGPTETTVWSSIKDLTGSNEINIGKPINNTLIYIVNKTNGLQPIGTTGELCISGEGLARGYLNNSKLTSEKFVPNLFVEGERMYKTGDLARWLPDGSIELLGRIDHQVKVRGFRIELEEIEAQLLNHEAIKESIVLVREDKNGAKYLCAYIVSKKELTIGELRTYLSKKLPEYMIPSYFVQLDKMPLTPNGKTDRKSLPEPDGSIVTRTEYEAPSNEAEGKLAAIWSEVLGVERVGINDNFFELGGHSLKAITLVSRMHKEFNTQISLWDLFNSPTIAGVNELIKKSKVARYREIKKLQRQEHYELSYAQKRLWIINQLNPSSIAYNMPGRVTLFEKVDKSLIKKVFDNLTARHEAFRTSFKKIDGHPVQIIDDEVDLHIDVVDLSQINSVEQMERREQIYVEHTTKIFNLERSHLIYVKLVKIKEEEYEMIFSMHHIISDGRSMEILKKEFAKMYNAYKQGEEINLEPLKVQYKDFASWQNKLIQDEVNIKEAKEFWRNQLSENVQALNLPFSYEPGNLKDNNSAGYRIVVKEDHKNKLKELARENNTSLFVVLLTTFKFFLADLTGQKDILIGTAGFGRNHEDLKNVIGYFINTTILRNEISTEESFVDLLKRINVNVLKALEHQNYPIELILDELKISYPKISAFFNMLNMGESNSQYIENLGTYHIEKVQDVKFDIVWYVTEYANGIEIMCNYLLGLFEASRIQSIMGEYLKTLEKILDNPNKSLKEFKVVTKKRKI